MKKKKNNPVLYLIPTPLGTKASLNTLSPQVVEIINQIDIFLSERAKTTRALLAHLPIKKSIQKFDIRPLSLHTSKEQKEGYIDLLRKGKTMGIISEAGCPGIADPGRELIRLAHENNFRIVPLVGPSSILLALMASGLNGQNFAFIGYLPKKKHARIKKIIQVEKWSRERNQTQIFIETPYRTHHLFRDLLQVLRNNTDLSLGVDLTLPTEFIATKKIYQWRKVPESVQLKNRYVVFSIHSGTEK